MAQANQEYRRKSQAIKDLGLSPAATRLAQILEHKT